ncbi:MAG: sigma 54-interacting transcriptional regulator, partial [Candidatus Omnitrophica bacterium]|nr:sigma 54-interacting transcriptional regulator [Candidatus Omnitrophota bacterium]
EIDAFSPALQVKLLRVLQDGEFERVGDTKTVKVDVRVIAATNQNLHDLITQGKFRQDLYYRLNIICIEVPPLRSRKEDIPLLLQDFITKHLQHTKKKITGVSEAAQALLMNYEWPGNIRELENVVERAIILTKGPVITPEDFPDSLHQQKTKANEDAKEDNLNLKDALKNPERDLILKALEAANWNRNKASAILGINRTTLYKKMQSYNLLKNNIDGGKK